VYMVMNTMFHEMFENSYEVERLVVLKDSIPWCVRGTLEIILLINAY
jgi:hypothetical protein